MSILSPIANAILSSLQSGIKSESKADGADFLSMLESNTGGTSGGNDFVAGAQSEQSLVDTLYEEKDEPDAPPAAPQVQAQMFEDAPAPKAPARDNDAPVAANEAQAPKEKSAAPDAPSAAPQEAPKKPQAENNTQNKAPDSLKAARTKEAANKNTAQENTDTAVPAADTASLADKIGAKVQELSDLLASVASLLGMSGAATQITVVQVTQTTTITATQQELGVNQPFADLSNRFTQLMQVLASMNGEKLPADLQQNLTQTIGAFQSLLTSVAPQNMVPGTQLVNDQLAAVESSLSVTMQSVQQTVATTPGMDMNALNAQLQKLQQWVSQFQPLAQQAVAAPQAATPDALPADDDAAIAAIIASAAQSPLKTAGKPAAKTTPDTKAIAEVAASQPAAQAAVPTPVVTTQPAAANAGTNTAIAAQTENNAGLQSNLSGGNSQQQSGQGSQQSAAAPVTGAAAAATASGAPSVHSASFRKALDTAAQAKPVPEQIAVNIKTAVKDGASKIQIHLDPGDLGKLHIKLELASDGTAKGIVITADNRATLDLLQRDARGLENALADAGIKADSGSLSFNLSGGEHQQAQEENTKGYAGYAAHVEEEDELAPLAVISRNYVVNVADGLDIKI